MLSVEDVRLFDYVVIGVSGAPAAGGASRQGSLPAGSLPPTCSAGATFLCCLASASYVAPWTRARRAAHGRQDFALFWKVRLWLNLVGGAWLVRPTAHLLPPGGPARRRCSCAVPRAARHDPHPPIAARTVAALGGAVGARQPCFPGPCHAVDGDGRPLPCLHLRHDGRPGAPVPGLCPAAVQGPTGVRARGACSSARCHVLHEHCVLHCTGLPPALLIGPRCSKRSGCLL